MPAQPEIIRDIHEEHLEAATDIIETDSYCSTATNLEHFSLEKFANSINDASSILSREDAN